MNDQKLDEVNAALINFLKSMPSGMHAQLVRAVVDFDTREYATFIALAETARGVECAHDLLANGARQVMENGLDQRMNVMLQQIGLVQTVEKCERTHDHSALITIEFPGNGISEQELEKLVGSKHVVRKSYAKGVSMVKVVQVDKMTPALAEHLTADIAEEVATCD